jgi:hypothetical protein
MVASMEDKTFEVPEESAAPKEAAAVDTLNETAQVEFLRFFAHLSCIPPGFHHPVHPYSDYLLPAHPHAQFSFLRFHASNQPHRHSQSGQ